MTDLMTEEEQVEQLKNWIKQYGMTILSGVIAALIIVTCWHYWQDYQNKILSHASRTYDEMLTLRAQNNTAGTSLQAQKLQTHYAKTPYATLAAMLLARDAVNSKNYAEAIKQLNYAIDHSKSSAMRAIALSRIARIYLTQNQPEQALAIMKQNGDKTFNGLFDEIRGDAYLLQKDTAKAKAAYQLALQELPEDVVSQRPILQMKLDNLATASDVA